MQAETRSFVPQQALQFLGFSTEDLIPVYHFLVKHAFRREPMDGLVMLRRAQPRASKSQWRGQPLLAQDLFDAAEVIRLFLTDLEVEVPSPELELMDGRQRERASVFAHGPAAPFARAELKRALVSASLYPGKVEVLVEGQSEITLVETLVAELLHPAALRQLNLFDLRGVGSAAQLLPLAEAFGGYASRTTVIVDREGKMGTYAARAVALGHLPAEDLCLADNSLEEDNAKSAELIALAEQQLARDDSQPHDASLGISVSDLTEYHTQLIENSQGERPGIARALVTLCTRRLETFRLDKVELARDLAKLMVDEYTQAKPESQEFQALLERRPILRFATTRIIPALDRSVF